MSRVAKNREGPGPGQMMGLLGNVCSKKVNEMTQAELKCSGLK